MTDWPETTLGDVVSSIGGLWGEDEAADGLVEVLALRGTDFDRARSLELDAVPRRFEKKGAVDRRLLDAASVVIEASGGSTDQPVGRSVLITPALLAEADAPLSAASFCKILQVDTALARPRFVQGLLQSLYMSGEIERFQSQSTGLRNLRTKQLLADFRFELPPLEIQDRVAAILSAFDELILLNRRRIRLLESTTHAVYRDRLVRPAGARRRPLGEIAQLRYGKALPKRKRRAGEVAVVSSAGIVDSHDVPLVRGPGVVVGRKGNVGSVWWVDRPFFPIDTTYYVESDLPLPALYWLLRDAEFIDSHAAVPGLNREQALAAEIALPPTAALERFAQIHEQLFAAISVSRELIGQLSAARDLLLPKLLRGALDLSACQPSLLDPTAPA